MKISKINTYLCSNKMYVILDLDSTLIYSRSIDITENISLCERSFCIKPITLENIMLVKKRKYVDEFLQTLFEKNYKVIVWSAGAPCYVKDIVSVLFRDRQPLHVFTKEHTNDGYKNLSTIANHIKDFDINKCCLVDDNESHMIGQEKHVLYIKPFCDTKEDDELKNMLKRIDEHFTK